MENLELKLSVIDQLEEMNDTDLVEVHNTYCRLVYGLDDEIHYNDSDGLQMLLGDGLDYMSFANKMFYGDYNPNHEYVKLDGYANLESFDDPAEHVYNSDMVDTILENLEEFEDLLDLDY